MCDGIRSNFQKMNFFLRKVKYVFGTFCKCNKLIRSFNHPLRKINFEKKKKKIMGRG